ncbi:hypothetical protein D3C76_1194190 [compost metagenome]
MVTIFRHLCFLAQLLQITCFNGTCQVKHLVTRIINVIFTCYVISGIIEDVAERITHSRSTGMSQMQAACRVRTDKLHLDLAPFADIDPSVVLTLFMNKSKHRVKVALVQFEVDKSWSGNLCLLDSSFHKVQIRNDLFCNLAWVALGNLGQLHCSIGRQIPVRLVTRHFKCDGWQFLLRNEAGSNNSIADRGTYPFVNRI